MDRFLIFIVVLGILIFFHELGHFLIARLFGVGVEKFSLGFGPRILGKTIGRTDYRICLVPLGGYVKMVGDEPNSPLDPEDLPLSFTHKHVAKRALIVAAGPIFNVLLALLIFTGSFLFAGLPSIRPIVRTVDSDGPAMIAGIHEGDIIRTINGNPVANWRDIDEIINNSNGVPLNFVVKRQEEIQNFSVIPEKIHAKNFYGDDVVYFDAGIKGYVEPSAIVHETVPEMPAQVAGLRSGDQIIAIDGHLIEKWETMQEVVSSSKGRTLVFTILRDGEKLEVSIAPVEVQTKDLLGTKQSVYQIGIIRKGITIPEEDKITVRFGPLSAIGQGFSNVWEMIYQTGYFFVRLFQGDVSKGAIRGPIGIAQIAHQQAQQGIVQLLIFIAVISINLAIINLIPIPVLDGGHILFFLIEAIQRRPVSIRVRETAQQIGFILLIMLMVFVIYNDIVITWF